MNNIETFLKFCIQAGSKTHKFVLENGRSFPIDPDTFKGRRKPQGMCFRNCTRMALEDSTCTYVEGFVTVHGIPIDHAWILRDGKLVDPTIRPVDGDTSRVSEYFGVPFSTKYLLQIMLKSGHYGVFGFESRKTLPDLIEGSADFKP